MKNAPILVIVVLVSVYIFVLTSNKTDPVVERSQLKTPVKTISIENIVTRSLQEYKGDYSVYIKNLQTGETYAINEDKVFTSASLYKLWVMLTAYAQIESGDLSKDKVFSESISYLNSSNNISWEYAERTRGYITLSVEEAIENMITYSDNYSALLLTQNLGIENITNTLRENGLENSNMGTFDTNPNTTAKDTALFFKKLYDKQLVSPQFSSQMLEFLKKQELNNKIPKYLPEGTVIAHKTGELYGFSHDAGIVYSPNANYVFVMLTEAEDTEESIEAIAKLSKEIYDYFN